MRNLAGMTRMAWLMGGVCLALSSCAHLGRASPQPAGLPVPLLREALPPGDGPVSPAVFELPLPPVGQAEVEVEPALPRYRGRESLPSPTHVTASAAALTAPALGEAEPSGRVRSEASLGVIEPSLPVAELSLRAGAEPAPIASAASVGAPLLPEAVAPRKPAASAVPAASASRGQGTGGAAATRAGASPAPAQPASSPSAAAVAAPAAASAAPRADRTVYARPNDDVEVAFEGEGWVLMDVQNLASPTGASGLRFVRRDLARDRTAFTFRAERLGEYAASFQLQHLATGVLESSRAEIKVVPASELASYVAGQGGGAGQGEGLGGASGRTAALTGSEPEVARAAADRLYGMGLNKAALEEYRKIAAASGVDPEVALRIAELNERLGNNVAALAQWLTLLSTQEYRERAVAGVVRSAAALGDGERVASSLDSLFRVRGFAIGRELLEVARYAERTSQDALELTVLEEYLARYPQGQPADEVVYRLGVLLEKAWEGRDLRRSLECYEAVLRDYPTSAFALASGDRVDYLKRHFFYVR